MVNRILHAEFEYAELNRARRSDNILTGEPALNKKAAELDIDKRLAGFARHKPNLIAMLREQYEGVPKRGHLMKNMRGLTSKASPINILQHEVELKEPRLRAPAAERMKLLLQFGNALRVARLKTDEMISVFRGHLVAEWCEAYGNPDFTDPIIAHYDAAFERWSIKWSQV